MYVLWSLIFIWHGLIGLAGVLLAEIIRYDMLKFVINNSNETLYYYLLLCWLKINLCSPITKELQGFLMDLMQCIRGSYWWLEWTVHWRYLCCQFSWLLSSQGVIFYYFLCGKWELLSWYFLSVEDISAFFLSWEWLLNFLEDTIIEILHL